MNIEVTTESNEPIEIEKEVNEEIWRFEQWFMNKLKNTRLVGSERAILKTYIGYKAKLYK